MSAVGQDGTPRYSADVPHATATGRGRRSPVPAIGRGARKVACHFDRREKSSSRASDGRFLPAVEMTRTWIWARARARARARATGMRWMRAAGSAAAIRSRTGSPAAGHSPLRPAKDQKEGAGSGANDSDRRERRADSGVAMSPCFWSGCSVGPGGLHALCRMRQSDMPGLAGDGRRGRCRKRRSSAGGCRRWRWRGAFIRRNAARASVRGIDRREWP